MKDQKNWAMEEMFDPVRNPFAGRKPDHEEAVAAWIVDILPAGRGSADGGRAPDTNCCGPRALEYPQYAHLAVSSL